jgi:hypothetical protein
LPPSGWPVRVTAGITLNPNRWPLNAYPLRSPHVQQQYPLSRFARVARIN